MRGLTDQERYEKYVMWCLSLVLDPADFETWSNSDSVLSTEEIIRHETDKFLAKCHPNGANLAGMKHGRKA